LLKREPETHGERERETHDTQREREVKRYVMFLGAGLVAEDRDTHTQRESEKERERENKRGRERIKEVKGYVMLLRSRIGR